MDNYKEYLDPADGYALVKQSVNMPRNPDWIEIPEGSEIAIKFNVDNSGHGVCFYKNNGKLSFSQKNPIWKESEWTQKELLDEDFRNGDVDFAHKVLWIRKPQDPSLISGADALRALADGEEVEASTECSPTIWEDAANYSANEFLAEETAETEDYCSMKLFFRLKPQTIKLDLELPKPFEPKDGEVYYYLKPSNAWGFGCGEWGDDSMQNEYIQYGAWPTKEDVLKVVEQLRKIRGTNS